MRTIVDPATAADRTRTLLVLLPGADMTAQDFVDHGFFAGVRQRSKRVDIVAVDTGSDRYLGDGIARELHDVITALGPMRLWIGGVSLGALGALLVAQAYPGLCEGLMLVSPYIGSRGLIAEIGRTGGLMQWSTQMEAEPSSEGRLLRWLVQQSNYDIARPVMYLGFGSRDRFSAGHRLLSEILPELQVVRTGGGHDWPSWEDLWEKLLTRRPRLFEAPDEV